MSEAPAAAASPAPRSPKGRASSSRRKARRVTRKTPSVARIIAIANQKGGVGKSTTAVSLGAALADLGYRVLVVDLDPQGNASTGLGIGHDSRAVSVYDVVVAEAPIASAVVPTAVPGLSAVPSTIDLAGAEIELVSQFSREARLKKAFDPVRQDSYDFIFLDCPPSLGLLTINALTAAEELIVPIQCEYYALEGLGQLLRNVSLVQQNINPDLRLSGIVMTMFDPRTKLSEQVVAEVQRFFGDLVYDVIIPRTVRLSEAPGYGQPITVYDPRSKGAEAYRDLAREVAARPPPEQPIPSLEELPTVVVRQPAAASDDTVRRSDDEEPELADVPTVSELATEEQGRAASREAGPAPAERQEAESEPERAEHEPERVEPDQAEEAGPEEAEPPTVEAPRVEPARGGEVQVSGVRSRAEAPAVDDDVIWDEPDDQPRIRPAPTPVGASDPRVVVIDENDDRDVESAREQLVQITPPDQVAITSREDDDEIGATLKDQGSSKRRWRLFRKGGE